MGILGASGDGSSVYYAANGVPDGTANSPNGNGESAELGDCEGFGTPDHLVVQRRVQPLPAPRQRNGLHRAARCRRRQFRRGELGAGGDAAGRGGEHGAGER